jgi:predicted PurR-regulated permease PerM
VSVTSDPVGPVLPKGLVIALGLAASVVVIAGMREARDLLAPTFLALVLTILVHPLRRWLDRHIPSWAASAVCVVVGCLIVLGLVFAVVVSLARFGSLLPKYEDEFEKQVHDFTDWLSSIGIGSSEIDKVASSFDLSRLGGVVEHILSSTLSIASGMVFILALVLFMAMDGANFPRQLAKAGRARPRLVDAIESFAVGTRRYLAVSSIFGLIVAVIDTIALALMGIPAPLVWGLLAFITNYIPNIGFVIGLVPPAILALLEGGPGLMIAVIVVYSLINVIIQTVIQPKFVGDAVGLSTTLTFLSLVFWAWVLGGLGALLAIPLTLLVKALFVDFDPDHQWLRPLLSNKDDQPEQPADPSPA